MIASVLADGLCLTDGTSLAWEDNEGLFNWPGELIYGGLVPVATDTPEQFEPPEDWAYKLQDRGRARDYVDRSKKLDSTPPDAPIWDLREQYLKGPVKPEAGPGGPQFARPTQAASYQARQNRDRTLSYSRIVDNPLLDSLNCRTLLADWPTGEKPPSFYAGAQWVLDSISSEFFSAALVPSHLTDAVGPRYAAHVLISLIDHRHAKEIIRRWRESQWRTVSLAIDGKLEAVQEAMTRWALAGHQPAQKPDGGLDPVITLANAVTATAAIYHLAKLGKALQDFQETGRQALSGLLE